MPAYLGGPAWPELDAALTRRDFRGALRLAEGATDQDEAERQLVIGICHGMFRHSEQALAALVESFRRFSDSRPARP